MSDRTDRSDRIDGPVTRVVMPPELWLPGIMGAVLRVSDARVMDAVSRWRQRGGVDVSAAMREKILKVLPAAVVDLKAREERRVVHVAAQARLRAGLQGLSHERCVKPLTPTLREVAERAGMNYQTLVNFRTSERPMSRENMRRLARAMREMGLLREKTLRGGAPETGRIEN